MLPMVHSVPQEPQWTLASKYLGCVFGFTVSFVALHVGYQAEATPEGVSRATTTTVVVASLAILALDLILTALMFS